jgi:predicted MFS family arabinose efflux permease
VKTGRPSPHLVVFALWLLVFSASSQIMIMSPILPRIGEELGIPDAMLGTLVSAYALMVGVFAILSGPVSDRVGRRRILLAGAGVMTVALLLHVFVVDYVSFLAVRLFAGMAGGVLSGAAVSYIGDYFPYNRRGWASCSPAGGGSGRPSTCSRSRWRSPSRSSSSRSRSPTSCSRRRG